MKARLILLTFITLANLATAQTEAKTNQPAAAIKALTSAYQEKMTSFIEKSRSVDKEQRRELFRKEHPRPEETIAALNKIIESHPKDPATFEAIAWIASKTHGNGLTPANFANLKENHLDHEKLASLLSSIAYSKKPETLAFLHLASEKSSVKNVRGAAFYALAMNIKHEKSKAAEHDALIKKLISDYPDLSINGRDITKRLIADRDSSTKLAIGQPAPEIIGKDVDGQEMKLSDYKGKVVVLHFWGDW